MSDAVSHSEKVEDVEDVLSSIKRLVSATDKPRPQGEDEQETAVSDDTQMQANAGSEDKKTGALLLTSALRVPAQPEEPASALETLRESVNETIASEDETAPENVEEAPDMTVFSDTSSLHWIAPSPVSDYYEDEAADDGLVSGLPPEVLKAVTPSHESDNAPRASAEVLRLVPTVAKPEPAEVKDTPDPVDEINESVEAEEAIEPLDDDLVAQDEELSEEHAVAPEATTPEFSADADLDPTDDGVSDSVVHDPDAEHENAFEDDWNLEDLDPEFADASVGRDESDWDASAKSQSYLNAAEAAADPWDDVVAAGSAPFSREQDEPDVAGVATFVRSGRAVTYTEVEDFEAEDLTAIPDAETIEDDLIKAEVENFPSGVFEDDIIDEEALREMVAEIVREELTGALGQRITRSVRKLVRQEINRALAAQELD